MNLWKKWIKNPYAKYEHIFKFGFFLFIGCILCFVIFSQLPSSIRYIRWVGIGIGYTALLGFLICIIAEVHSVKHYNFRSLGRVQKKLTMPPALLLILVFSILFWAYTVFSQSMILLFFDYAYSVDSIWLFQHASKLVVGIFIIIAVFGIVKGYRWSWYGAIGMSVAPTIIIGIEIIVIYVIYQIIPKITVMIYSYLPILFPSILFLYYFTRPYVKNYLLHG